MDYRQRIYAQYASVAQDGAFAPELPVMDRWGTAYDTYLRGWLPEHRDAPILDLACGYGRLLRFFTKRGYTRVTGVDVSPEQVELARRVHPGVLQGDVLQFLGQHPGEFALITAFDILEHLNKPEALQFLDACAQALQPGGALILQTPNGDSPWGLGVRYGDFTHETCFTPHALGWLLRVCGFEKVEPREQGPVIRGLVSGIRWVLWQWLRGTTRLRNLVETGSGGSGICTRVFVIRARRP